MFALMLSVFMGKERLYYLTKCPRLNSTLSYSAQGGSPMNLSLMDSTERYHQEITNGNGIDSESVIEQTEEEKPKQYETEASSLIKLDNGDVLYMREVNR